MNFFTDTDPPNSFRTGTKGLTVSLPGSMYGAVQPHEFEDLVTNVEEWRHKGV